MELKKGMYIRFKDKRGIQYIRRIVSVNAKQPDKRYAAIYIDKETNNCNGISLKNIIGNPSFNPIDLIESGDYVNNKRVKKIRSFFTNETRKYIEFEDGRTIYEDMINNILTKEQYDACKYVVERNK